MKGSLKGVVQNFGAKNESCKYCKAAIKKYMFEDYFFECLKTSKPITFLKAKLFSPIIRCVEYHAARLLH